MVGLGSSLYGSCQEGFAAGENRCGRFSCGYTIFLEIVVKFWDFVVRRLVNVLCDLIFTSRYSRGVRYPQHLQYVVHYSLVDLSSICCCGLRSGWLFYSRLVSGICDETVTRLLCF